MMRAPERHISWSYQGQGHEIQKGKLPNTEKDTEIGAEAGKARTHSSRKGEPGQVVARKAKVWIKERKRVWSKAAKANRSWKG